MITKKGDGSQVKESTDSSTTLEDDDVKGDIRSHIFLFCLLFFFFYFFWKSFVFLHAFKNFLIFLFFYIFLVLFFCNSQCITHKKKKEKKNSSNNSKLIFTPV